MTEKTLGTAKVSTKGQVTIPADARRKFDLNTGDLIVFTQRNGELLIRKG